MGREEGEGWCLEFLVGVDWTVEIDLFILLV